MLTGDHPLTAISIAHSSGLISEDILPIIIDTNKFNEISFYSGNMIRLVNTEKFMTISECSCCHGKKLRPEALGVTVGKKNIMELCELSVSESIEFFDEYPNIGFYIKSDSVFDLIKERYNKNKSH